MTIMKPSASLDTWRGYFHRGDSDIFGIIEHAIMVAATDSPVELKSRRDAIIELLLRYDQPDLSNAGDKETNNSRKTVETDDGVMKKMRRNWTLIKLLMRSWGSKISCWTNMLRFCLFALITSEEVIYSYRVCLWYWFWLSGFGFCHLSFCSHLCYSNPWQSLPPCLSAWILLRFVSGAVLVMYMIWYHGWIWNNPMNIGLQF